MRLYLDLTKSGIVAFTLVSGLAGFALSIAPYESWDWMKLVFTMAALYFLSSGSFALNQAQEHKIDLKMPRTEARPIPSGKVSVYQATVLGLGYVIIGGFFAALVNEQTFWLGILTVVLYNIPYTLFWKKRWAFGAVPGAIPGAMPVVIGYAANAKSLFAPEIVYAFTIMFLWQMPHFWSLAIRFKDDYAKGGIPVLPVKLGTERTLFHMGLYTFAYVGLAVASPFFTSAYFAYGLIVLPFAFKVLYEFFRYYQTGASKRWLPFFLWTNFSVLVFLIAPVIDKWHRFVAHSF